jgi:hypothetical protein
MNDIIIESFYIDYVTKCEYADIIKLLEKSISNGLSFAFTYTKILKGDVFLSKIRAPIVWKRKYRCSYLDKKLAPHLDDGKHIPPFPLRGVVYCWTINKTQRSYQHQFCEDCNLKMRSDLQKFYYGLGTKIINEHAHYFLLCDEFHLDLTKDVINYIKCIYIKLVEPTIKKDSFVW